MWRPTATRETLKIRAQFLQRLRQYMFDGGVLEIESPMLSSAGGTDINIDLISTDSGWLASSPEFPLKRLLCAGYGDVFSLQKVFRRGEAGKKHNPEFTMLEWYRVGWDYVELMDEVQDLCSQLMNMPKPKRLSYRELFITMADIDPMTASDLELSTLGSSVSGLEQASLDRDGWLDVIFSFAIEPKLLEPVFIFDFPASQAALAKVVDHEGHQVAQRFELVWQGVELANGYQELTDVDEQRARFDRDLSKRTERAQDLIKRDDYLLSAMEAGMPECAGVAMGIDRMLMLHLQCERIADVMPFPFDRT